MPLRPLTDGRYQGTPSLVVEILSPSTRKKDAWNKLHLYSDCGINEYWIVDPKYKTVTLYNFPEHEIFPVAVYTAGQAVKSVLFDGLEVPVGRLFEKSPGRKLPARTIEQL